MRKYAVVSLQYILFKRNYTKFSATDVHFCTDFVSVAKPRRFLKIKQQVMGKTRQAKHTPSLLEHLRNPV